MAAFLNALAEEGTKADIIRFIKKQRQENKLPQSPDEYYDHWHKVELLQELSYLWDSRPLG